VVCYFVEEDATSVEGEGGDAVVETGVVMGKGDHGRLLMDVSISNIKKIILLLW